VYFALGYCWIHFAAPGEAAAIANPHPTHPPSQRVTPGAVIFYEVIGQTAVKSQEK